MENSAFGGKGRLNSIVRGRENHSSNLIAKREPFFGVRLNSLHRRGEIELYRFLYKNNQHEHREFLFVRNRLKSTTLFNIFFAIVPLG